MAALLWLATLALDLPRLRIGPRSTVPVRLTVGPPTEHRRQTPKNDDGDCQYKNIQRVKNVVHPMVIREVPAIQQVDA